MRNAPPVDPGRVNVLAVSTAYAALAGLEEDEQRAALAWLAFVLRQDGDAVRDAVDEVTRYARDLGGTS